MSKLIVILGITGSQGGGVARLFKTLPDWRIRGITRDPSKPSVAALREAGIELVAGDLDDPASLVRAFEGANAIFSVTDSFQSLQHPATAEEVQKTGRLPNEVAMDREIQQGRNVIDAAAKQLNTLDRLVLSTLSDSEKWSNGAITHNCHYDAKARYCDYVKTAYPDTLAKKTSYLQMGHYVSNWRMAGPLLAPQKQSDGVYAVPSMAKADGIPMPWVDPPNDTGHFVKALIEAPAGSSMLGYSEMLTGKEYVALWGKTLGVPAHYKDVGLDAMKAADLPKFLAEEMNEMREYVSLYGFDGGDPEVKNPKELGVDVSKLTKIEDWIKNEDWSSVL